MSNSGQPRFRDGKTSTPNSVYHDTGFSDPHHNKYSLNLKAGPSPPTYKVPEPKKIGRVRLWIKRNPRRFHWLFVTVGLSIFFSRPIYDIFIRTPTEGPRPKEKRSLGISF